MYHVTITTSRWLLAFTLLASMLVVGKRCSSISLVCVWENVCVFCLELVDSSAPQRNQHVRKKRWKANCCAWCDDTIRAPKHCATQRVYRGYVHQVQNHTIVLLHWTSFSNVVKRLFLLRPFGQKKHFCFSFWFFFSPWFLCVFPRSLIKANASISDCRCHINQAVPCCRWWRWPSALRPGGGVWGGVANASLTYHYHLASHLFCPTASRSITMPLSHSIPFPFLQGSTKSATIYAPGMNSSSLRPASFASGALHGNNRRCRDAHPHAGTNHTSYLRVALIPGSVTPN